MAEGAGVSFRIDERPEVPVLGLLFGGAAMVPFAVLAAAVWVAPAPWPATALRWLVLWGAAVLAFLAGVRRGLSFRTPGGERPVQLATMLWLFVLAVAALVASPPWALVALLLGTASLAVLDPAAARRQEAPLFFARLRPVQMLVPLASLAAALAWTWRH